MIRSLSLLTILGLTLLLPLHSQAQSLAIAQSPKSDKDLFSITLPPRGMSMAKVEEQFGEPQDIEKGVGKPPITRWVYGTFTVYFEDQYVIHAVLHKVK